MREADRVNAETNTLLDRINESQQPRAAALDQSLHEAHGEEVIFLEQIEKLIDAYLTDQLNEYGGLGATK